MAKLWLSVLLGTLAHTCLCTPVPKAIPVAEFDQDFLNSIVAESDELPPTCLVLLASGRDSWEYVTMCATSDTVLLHTDSVDDEIAPRENTADTVTTITIGKSNYWSPEELLDNLLWKYPTMGAWPAWRPQTTASARVHHSRRIFSQSKSVTVVQHHMFLRQVAIWLAAFCAVFAVRKLLTDFFGIGGEAPEMEPEYAQPPRDQSEAPPPYDDMFMVFVSVPTIKEV